MLISAALNASSFYLHSNQFQRFLQPALAPNALKLFATFPPKQWVVFEYDKPVLGPGDILDTDVNMLVQYKIGSGNLGGFFIFV